MPKVLESFKIIVLCGLFAINVFQLPGSQPLELGGDFMSFSQNTAFKFRLNPVSFN